MIRLLRPLLHRSGSRRSAFLALTIVGLVGVLGLPSAALAAAPQASTNDVVSTGATTSTVDGLVNPGGESTTYAVQWDLNSSTWCQSFGTSGSPANTTSATPFPDTGNTFEDVTVDLTGLTAGSDYCAQLIANNGSGESDGGTVEWTQGLPEAITFDTFSTASTTATVEGTANAVDQSAMYQVQYDTATSTWCQNFGTSGSPANHTSPQPFGFSDDTFHDLSVDLSGLTEKTLYCAQLIVTNGSGEGDGGTASWTQGAPTVDTNTAAATGATTATLTGDVNPGALDTSYEAEYDLASSDWCTSGGTASSPAHTTGPTDVGATDGAFHDVTVDLTGLSASTDYCGEIVATNDDGEGDSFQLPWSQPATPKHTLTVSRAGSGSGAVTSSPGGINCGATCSAMFDEGTLVTLTATPDAGSTFAGWSGGGCSGFGTCMLTLNADTTVTAFYGVEPPKPPLPITHMLAVTFLGGGSGTVTSSPPGIQCADNCSVSFNAGTVVTLTATPSPGSVFAGWSGGCSGTDTCTVTTNADYTLSATFNTVAKPKPKPSCSVPKLKGKTLTAAKAALKKAHCGLGKITKAFSAKLKKGRVVSQKPAPGTKHPAGTKVKLTLSKGKKP